MLEGGCLVHLWITSFHLVVMTARRPMRCLARGRRLGGLEFSIVNFKLSDIGVVSAEEALPNSRVRNAQVHALLLCVLHLEH